MPLRILLVEDDPLVAMTTAAMLEDLGHQVIEAMSGADAFEKSAGATIDMLLTDISLPDINGADLARQLRTDRPDLPVVFSTGHAPGDGGAPHVPGPVAVHLGKPFGMDELRIAIETATPKG